MSKTISIKEDDVSCNFTVEKLRTKLQAGGTCDWIPEDEINEYVELEELNVTENGTYTPQTKVGFSSVYVEVSGGGGGADGPRSIDEVQARAAGNLQAGDCVAVMDGGQGGTASTVQCVFTGKTNTKVAYDSVRKKVYFHNEFAIEAHKAQSVPLSDLNGTPTDEITYPGSWSGDPFALCRNTIAYMDSANLINVKCLNTGEVVNTGEQYMYSDQWYIGNAYASSENYIYYGGFRKISTMQLVSGLYTSNWSELQIIDDTHVVRHYNGIYVQIYEGTTVKESYTLSERLNNTKVLNGYLVGHTNDGKLAYAKLGETQVNYISGVVASTYSYAVIKHNAEGTLLWASLMDNGLAIVYPDMTAVVYDNIQSANGYSEMFDDYFWNGATGTMYFVPQSRTMKKSNDKDEGTLLGWVSQDVADGATGTAHILFN